ncbi:hypothetical protein [Amycolatopsis plumensis]|uniref:Uncharacterized protein n=1 Tax=Amycolatopsis plumensis TaxID=236508 RepID=A0ABV5UI82_9PSEU
MAADDGSLYRSTWGIWWGVWILTLLLLLAAGVILVRHWRRAHRGQGTGPISGIAFYLHHNSVMGLYQQDRYSEALEKEIEKRSHRGRSISGRIRFPAGEATGEQNRTEEVFSRYIERAEPITVIGMVMEVLEKRDDIVYVDLVKRELVQNKALVTALGWADGPDTTRLRTARLRGMDAFVSMRGLFRRVRSDEPGYTTFIAAYGDPADPLAGPRVRFRCGIRGFRDADEVPDGTFHAQCLGRVEDWDPHRGELIVHPIAIFK